MQHASARNEKIQANLKTEILLLPKSREVLLWTSVQSGFIPKHLDFVKYPTDSTALSHCFETILQHIDVRRGKQNNFNIMKMFPHKKKYSREQQEIFRYVPNKLDEKYYLLKV